MCLLMLPESGFQDILIDSATPQSQVDSSNWRTASPSTRLWQIQLGQPWTTRLTNNSSKLTIFGWRLLKCLPVLSLDVSKSVHKYTMTSRASGPSWMEFWLDQMPRTTSWLTCTRNNSRLTCSNTTRSLSGKTVTTTTAETSRQRSIHCWALPLK